MKIQTAFRNRWQAIRPGFSLVELLAVLVIASILLAVLVPSIQSITGSTALGVAAQSLMDEIHLCRSNAQSLNKPVELCFMRAGGNATDGYTEIRSRSVERDGSTQWISRQRTFPEGIAVSPSAILSNLLGTQTVRTNDLKRSEACLRFGPSGEMNRPPGSAALSQSAEFLTLGFQRDFQNAPDTLPGNFATIQIDPRNSQATLYRP